MKNFNDLSKMATCLRGKLEKKDYVLIFGYNGVGKTRLSIEFRNIGWQGKKGPDTLYYNAYTEDLFTWDNDVPKEKESVLRMNKDSSFFKGLEDLVMESRIREQLCFYADFDFRIDYDEGTVRFYRNVAGKRLDNVKISRGEENTFIWCFFLAIVEIAMDDSIESYNWVKYLYIDDPISSLDEHNAISVAFRLAGLLKAGEGNRQIKTVISSHHTLFFNVMCNGLKGASRLFLSKAGNPPAYSLQPTGETPFFHHVATLKELCDAANSNNLYTHHFNMLRTILEKSASFHGFSKFTECIDQEEQELHARLLNVQSHGNLSLYEPIIMPDDRKDRFKKILNQFLRRYRFNPEHIAEVGEEV